MSVSASVSVRVSVRVSVSVSVSASVSVSGVVCGERACITRGHNTGASCRRAYNCHARELLVVHGGQVLCSILGGHFGRGGGGGVRGGSGGVRGGGGVGGVGGVGGSGSDHRGLVLSELARAHDLAQITRVTGKMVIWINGEQIYQKGGFNAENPQPTPAEVEVLMGECFPSLPWTDDEAVAFQALHEEQIQRGASKH